MKKANPKAFASAYLKHQGNQTRMAKELGIARITVNRNLKGYLKKYPSLFKGNSPLAEIKDIIILIVEELSKTDSIPKNTVLELKEKIKQIYT